MIKKINGPSTQHAFTLIEMLIGVAIISILVWSVAQSYTHYVQKATVTKAFAIMQEAKNEIASTYAVTGLLPQNGTLYLYDRSTDAEIEQISFVNTGSHSHIVTVFGPSSGGLEDDRLWFSVDTTNPSRLTWSCKNFPWEPHSLPDSAVPSECDG